MRKRFVLRKRSEKVKSVKSVKEEGERGTVVEYGDPPQLWGLRARGGKAPEGRRSPFFNMVISGHWWSLVVNGGHFNFGCASLHFRRAERDDCICLLFFALKLNLSPSALTPHPLGRGH